VSRKIQKSPLAWFLSWFPFLRGQKKKPGYWTNLDVTGLKIKLLYLVFLAFQPYLYARK
jgi:hypothetical protein